jgi:hypothetical protein
LLTSPLEFKSHFVTCLVLVSWLLMNYIWRIHGLFTWPCALTHLGFTLGTFLKMRGSAREVYPWIYYLHKWKLVNPKYLLLSMLWVIKRGFQELARRNKIKRWNIFLGKLWKTATSISKKFENEICAQSWSLITKAWAIKTMYCLNNFLRNSQMMDPQIWNI